MGGGATTPRAGCWPRSTPDLALHFGVSSRARGFEIEQRARNACAATPDASGALPTGAAISDGGTEHLPASLPVRHIVARLRQLGIPAFVSRDAGTYLCNAALYHSLVCAKDKDAAGRRVGFVHIPATLARPGGPNRGRTGACPLTWDEALDGALEILAACLGRARPGAARLRAGRLVRRAHASETRELAALRRTVGGAAGSSS